MEKLNLIVSKKKEIKKLYKEIDNMKILDKKLKIFKEILEINNTEEKIVFEYLILLKELHKNYDDSTIKKELEKYINHIPKNKFNDNFSNYILKESSSLEELNSIIQKILSIDWFSSQYDERAEVIFFFDKIIYDNNQEIHNTSPVTWENSELYIYICFQDFITQIYKKMEYYKGISKKIESKKLEEQDKLINDIEEKIKTCPKDEKDIYIQLINEAKEKRKTIYLIEGNFFKNYLSKFNMFLTPIKDTFLKDINNLDFNLKENQYIFEYFMIFISNYDFENLDQEIITAWDCSFKELNYNEKIEIIKAFKINNFPFEFVINEDNKNTLLIYLNNNKIFEIENIDDYEIRGLCMNIFINRNFNIYNKYSFIKYAKIPKIRNHLYISHIMKDWISFNI